jgi:hypothetical protein
MFRITNSVWLAISLAGATAAWADEPGLKFERFRSAAGRFSLDMPGQPEITEQSADGIAIHKFSVAVPATLSAFRLVYFDVPESVKGKNPQDVIQAYETGSRAGAAFKENKEITLGEGKAPGREYRLVAADGVFVRERTYLAGGRLYSLHVAALRDQDFLTSAEANRFFDSFQLLLSLAPAAPAKGELVDVKGLSVAVTDAVKRAAPQVEWLVAFKYAEEGKRTWFKLSGRDKQNRSYQSSVYADGGVLAVSTEVPLGEVPSVVVEALKAQSPGFIPKKAEAFGVEVKTIHHYRFEGEMPRGKKAVMLVQPDGGKVAPGK